MPDAFQNLSAALVKAVDNAGHGVVRIEARRRLPASGIVWSVDGVIVTASHVVEREENISVGLPGGRTVSAAFVGRDPSTDLAALRVQETGLQPFSTLEAASLHVGQLVLALARPGQNLQSSLGSISALGEGWRTPGGARLERLLRADVSMFPGFSGGPLVDAAGGLIGLNTTALLRDRPLTIPAETIARVTEALLAHGRVKRGYLGVGSQPVRLPAALTGQLGQETGLLVSSVEPGSPADQAGLLLGDTLVAFNGEALRHMDDLLSALGSDQAGKQAVLSVIRGGQVIEVQVKIGERE